MATIKPFGERTQIPLSPALRTDNLVFISGQVPVDGNGEIVEGIEAQTRLVLEKIKSLVESAGSNMGKVVKTTVFLTDVNDFAKMNSVYAEFFPDTPPTRSTLRCELMIDIKVEIEAIALV